MVYICKALKSPIPKNLHTAIFEAIKGSASIFTRKVLKNKQTSKEASKQTNKKHK